MKTKLIASVIFVVATVSFHAEAQKFYATLGGGYAFSAPGNIMLVNYNYTGPFGWSNKEENIYGTYGKGLTTNASVGYMLADFIGIEIGCSFIKTEQYEYQTNDFRNISFMYLTVMNSKITRIFSAVKITGGKRIKPYVKCGFVYGIGTEVTIDDVTSP